MYNEISLDDIVNVKKMPKKEDVWEQVALELGFNSDKYYSAKEKLLKSGGSITGSMGGGSPV